MNLSEQTTWVHRVKKEGEESSSVNQHSFSRSSRDVEIKKLKVQQQSYAQTLGNKGVGFAALRAQMERGRT